eukprot:282792-Rhodomonas_salina.1
MRLFALAMCSSIPSAIVATAIARPRLRRNQRLMVTFAAKSMVSTPSTRMRTGAVPVRSCGARRCGRRAARCPAARTWPAKHELALGIAAVLRAEQGAYREEGDEEECRHKLHLQFACRM